MAGFEVITEVRWKRVNLTDAPVILDREVLDPRSPAVRENYYRGKFGAVRAKSRLRKTPLSSPVVQALLELRAESKFTLPEDLVFASRTGGHSKRTICLGGC